MFFNTYIHMYLDTHRRNTLYILSEILIRSDGKILNHKNNSWAVNSQFSVPWNRDISKYRLLHAHRIYFCTAFQCFHVLCAISTSFHFIWSFSIKKKLCSVQMFLNSSKTFELGHLTLHRYSSQHTLSPNMSFYHLVITKL